MGDNINTNRSGGTRHQAGKPPVICIPWGGLFEVGRISGNVTQTDKEYAPYDFRVGQDMSALMNSFGRHVIQVMIGGPSVRDPKSGHLHLGHAAWNALCALEQIELGKAELDDVTPFMGVSNRMLTSAKELAKFQEVDVIKVLREHWEQERK